MAYGNPDGYTAMARTVSIPTAIAADMVLNGKKFIPLHCLTVSVLGFSNHAISKAFYYSQTSISYRGSPMRFAPSRLCHSPFNTGTHRKELSLGQASARFSHLVSEHCD